MTNQVYYFNDDNILVYAIHEQDYDDMSWSTYEVNVETNEEIYCGTLEAPAGITREQFDIDFNNYVNQMARINQLRAIAVN